MFPPKAGKPNKGEQMVTLHLAARGIIQRIPEKLGEAYSADLCQRDRLRQQIAREEDR
jgi:hypothetical protein